MYKILNQTSSNTEILLYSLIMEGWTANRVIDALNAAPSENITLRINSDGGEVFEAITLYNYLKDKNVAVVIDGICASAASIIAMAGKSITMKQGSMMMIHQPLTLSWGNADDLRDQADILDKITASLAGIYAVRTGKSTDDVMDLMKAETWMTDTEALNAGFVDSIETTPEPKDETPPPAEPPAPHTEDRTDDAVKAERERLRLLDELYTPERARVINRAKYETFQTAQDIAIELLKAERVTNSRKTDDVELSSLPAKTRDQNAIDAMVETINSMRR